MNSMFFIIRKQLKNIIRGLAYKPLALIGYIIIGMMLACFIVIALIMPSGTVRNINGDLFSAAVTGFNLMALYTGLRRGIEKGSTYFRFADVNMVFTAPLKPSHVLLYGFIKRMGTSLLVVLIAFFQIPNIKNNFILAKNGVVAFLIAVLFYSVSSPVLGMVVYSFASKSGERRILVKRILDISAVLFILGFVLTLAEKRSLGDALIAYLNSVVFSYIPVSGQISAIASAAVYGIDLNFFVNIFVLVVIIGFCMAAMSGMNLDFYEDVLNATEEFESRIRAKREGRDASLETKKIRRVKGGFSSCGAKTIFEKHMLEYRKISYFLFFDKSTLIVILGGIGSKFIMPEEASSVFITLFFSAYMLFFLWFRGNGQWSWANIIYS